MEKYIAVALGGATGALCRMALGEWVMTKVSSFPYGTVVVNLVGCLIIGLVLGLYMQKPDLPQWVRFFLVVGGLGAFTTFSTFAFEMLQLMMAESYVYIVQSRRTTSMPTQQRIKPPTTCTAPYHNACT